MSETSSDGLYSGSHLESLKRREAWWPRVLALGGGGLFILACAPGAIFPPEVLETVDRTVTFEQVLKHPANYKGRVVEFGGQTVGSIVEREEVQMLVRELPIQTKPVYGPRPATRIGEAHGSGARFSSQDKHESRDIIR